MPMFMDIDRFRNALLEELIKARPGDNYTRIIEIVVNKLLSGFPIAVMPHYFKLNGGDQFTIEMNNPNPSSLMKNCHWTAKIEGLLDAKIMSISIPTLESGGNYPLCIDIKILPFKIESPIKKKLECYCGDDPCLCERSNP